MVKEPFRKEISVQSSNDNPDLCRALMAIPFRVSFRPVLFRNKGADINSE